MKKLLLLLLISFLSTNALVDKILKNGFLSGQWIKWYAPGFKEEEGEYNQGIKVGTWSRYNIDGLIVEELNYDSQGRNLYEITYYKNGTVKEYKDYFSKTLQEYNTDGSLKGDKIPFH